MGNDVVKAQEETRPNRRIIPQMDLDGSRAFEKHRHRIVRQSEKPRSAVTDLCQYFEAILSASEPEHTKIITRALFNHGEAACSQIRQLMTKYQALFPHYDTVKTMVGLVGTIPFECADLCAQGHFDKKYHLSSTYHLRISIWMPPSFPKRCPVLYVEPERAVGLANAQQTRRDIMRALRVVDSSSRIRSPVMDAWNKKQSTLVGLIDGLRAKWDEWRRSPLKWQSKKEKECQPCKDDCPGRHGLRVQLCPEGRAFVCDVCERRILTAEQMHGCRRCNYDVCVACFEGDDSDEGAVYEYKVYKPRSLPAALSPRAKSLPELPMSPRQDQNQELPNIKAGRMTHDPKYNAMSPPNQCVLNEPNEDAAADEDSLEHIDQRLRSVMDALYSQILASLKSDSDLSIEMLYETRKADAEVMSKQQNNSGGGGQQQLRVNQAQSLMANVESVICMDASWGSDSDSGDNDVYHDPLDSEKDVGGEGGEGGAQQDRQQQLRVNKAQSLMVNGDSMLRYDASWGSDSDLVPNLGGDDVDDYDDPLESEKDAEPGSILRQSSEGADEGGGDDCARSGAQIEVRVVVSDHRLFTFNVTESETFEGLYRRVIDKDPSLADNTSVFVTHQCIYGKDEGKSMAEAGMVHRETIELY